MESNIKEIVEQLIKEAPLNSKTRTGMGYHGSNKDVEVSYTVYWDVFNNVWTTKHSALQGYVFSKLSPIIISTIQSLNNQT